MESFHAANQGFMLESPTCVAKALEILTHVYKLQRMFIIH